MGCSIFRPTAAQTRVESPIRPRRERSPHAATAVESARDDRVTRPYHRLRRSAHGSGDCPTIAWYRVSCGMLNLPPDGRTDACGVSDTPSERTLAARCDCCGERSRRSRYTTISSAEAVGSWIRRLSHHRMVPCDLWDAQTPARRPHRRVWSLGSALRKSARCVSRERTWLCFRHSTRVCVAGGR